MYGKRTWVKLVSEVRGLGQARKGYRSRYTIPESESELFTGDTSKDNHSPGPVFREVSP